MPGWFGHVPTPVWVMICLGVAALYVRVWPRQKAAGLTRGARYVVLRWFHSLVWLLLAVAVAVRGQSGEQAYIAASAIALLAFAIYVVFLVVSFTSRRAQAQRDESRSA